MVKRIGHSVALAIVIVTAFAAGIAFGQAEGIRAGIARASGTFRVDQEIGLNLPFSQSNPMTATLNTGVIDDGACKLWMYGQEPPAVGFYYHPENGRLGVLFVSVPDMKYFLKTFEGCDLYDYGYLEYE